MMFDENTRKVLYFGTNDTSVMKGSYDKEVSGKLILNWDYGWSEVFNHSGGEIAILTDYYGMDWEYKVCDVYEAQKVLDTMK